MSSNTDRDPADQILIGEAVSEWLTSEDGDQDANNHLLMVLVEQGVLTPDEAAETNVLEANCQPVVVMVLASGTEVRVDEDGVVTVPR